MDIDKIDIYPTGGMCITLPKSIAALNRAVTWVKEEVLKQRYYSYYDLNVTVHSLLKKTKQQQVKEEQEAPYAVT